MQPKQFGIVHFDTQPHGARIYVDGQILVNPDTEESIKTPATVELIEGRRDFTFVLEGHEDVSGYVDIFPGLSVNIFRNMNPGKSQEGWGEPQPQISLTNIVKTGLLRIYSFPDGADTYVNGKYVGKSPLLVTDVPAGVATVRWKMPGMMDEEKIVDIVEGAWSDIYSTMRPVIPKLYYQQDYLQDYYQQDYLQDYYQQDYHQQEYYQQQSLQYETGTVYISSYPEGAIICIDGSLVTDILGNPAVTPCSVDLPIGNHEIILSLDGYLDAYEDITIYYPKEQLCVSINLDQKPPDITHISTGNVTIISYPVGATIYIDGSRVTDEMGNPIITPATVSILEGYHDIILSLNGYFDGYEYIYVYPGAELDVSINLSEKIWSTLYPEYLSETLYPEYLQTLYPEYSPENPDIPCVFPETPGQTATQGSLVSTTYPPGASIVLDGRTVIDLDTGDPITTPVQLVLTMGYHDLIFKLDGFFDEYWGVYVTPGYTSFVHRYFNVC